MHHGFLPWDSDILESQQNTDTMQRNSSLKLVCISEWWFIIFQLHLTNRKKLN